MNSSNLSQTNGQSKASFENETYKKLINSERLIKDAEHLMNSSYWIDQLKNNKASGIGNQLVYQLNESQQFVSDFIQFCVNVKKLYLKDLSKNYEIESLVNLTEDLDSKIEINLPIEFFVECIYLCLLDTTDFIGNTQLIYTKLTTWFQELKWIPKQQINQIAESVLNTTPCFKRLMNSNIEELFDKEKRSKSIRRPIILGKRQYIWSINLSYLKCFVRYFFKCGEKYKNFNIDCDFFTFDQTEIPSCSLEKNLINLEIPLSFLRELNNNNLGKYNFNSSQVINLYQCWKSKIEQLKLLIQLKHNNYGFNWCEPILINRNKPVYFMRKENNSRINKITDLSLSSKIINNRKQTINKKVKKPEFYEPAPTIVQLSNSIMDFHSNPNNSISDQSINDFSLSLNSSTSETSFDNSSQNFAYFNLLSIPTLIIDPNPSNNSNCVEHFLSNHDDEDDLRVVVSNDLNSITDHDKFIYF